MKYRNVLLLMVSLLRVSVQGDEMATAAEGDKSEVLENNCNFRCSRERDPICAADEYKSGYLMFDNACKLELFNCELGNEYREVDMTMCKNDVGELVARHQAMRARMERMNPMV